MDHAVMKMTKEGVGSYLTDAKMMTLYWFKKDSPGKERLHGTVRREVADLLQGDGRRRGRDESGGFRNDPRARTGKKQTTFRGYPLYYWAGDKARETPRGREWATSGM